jgi:thiamine kinase-like enzyme
MPEPDCLRHDVREKPAILAWDQLTGMKGCFPQCHRIQREGKSQVFRLVDPAHHGAPIIAKRCRRTTAMLEHTFYEHILPSMPLPRLSCHGLWQEENGGRCWLFLEDAGEAKYQPGAREHRALAARWLAALHTITVHPELEADLPDRGAGYYLDRLRASQNTLLRLLCSPLLIGDSAELLKALASQCEDLETNWKELDLFCSELPRVPVHCDFQPKNLRVSATVSGLTLFVFDWEIAGVGIPAIDLAELSSSSPDGSEFAVYWNLVCDRWPRLSFEHIRRLADLARILRLVNVLDWLSWSLAYEMTDGTRSIDAASPQRILRRMKSLRMDISEAKQGSWNRF